MIQKIKTLITSLSLLSALVLPGMVPVAVYAQSTACLDNPNAGSIQGCLGDGSCATDPQNCAQGANASDRVNRIIRLVINIFSLIVGVIAVIMIIIGGLKYITSGGDSGNITGAKNTILYAIIGLVVVALAQIIVRFVLDKVGQQG